MNTRLKFLSFGIALGTAVASTGTPATALAFERTEVREACREHYPLRKPFFGDLHVHTAFSLDASALGVRNTPRDAYRFATGEAVGLQPYDENGTPLRSARLERPLDFAAVTDHAELLGEVEICNRPGASGFGSLICRMTRRWPLLGYMLVNSAILNESEPSRYSFCGSGGRHCREAARSPWRRTQNAAEDFYDRSADCRFTTFVAYEWSGNPDSNMIHRNVIFRNERTQDLPSSYIETGDAEGLFQQLERHCLTPANPGCDVLTIPHNANLSGGQLFLPPPFEHGEEGARAAARRRRLEPLFEIIQHKGASECRRGGPAGDELCGFENLPFGKMDQYPIRSWWEEAEPGSYAREILGDGLTRQTSFGNNPFRFGFIGSTDSHMGTPGLVQEQGFPGGAAGGDTSALAVPERADRPFFNPGGLAVLWAEENSRDALFEAMQRREAYGTSGPRMVTRFFGGWSYGADACYRPDLAEIGYAGGVPMGGMLPPPPPGLGTPDPGTPRLGPMFITAALADPGSDSRPGTPLEAIQIVKLWNENGQRHERVYPVAVSPNPVASEPGTCAVPEQGARRLCNVWRDPDFRIDQAALYYTRVLEVPTCRWSWYECLEAGVTCSGEDPPEDFEYCCDGSTPALQRERAWTSPIWYVPEGMERPVTP